MQSGVGRNDGGPKLPMFSPYFPSLRSSCSQHPVVLIPSVPAWPLKLPPHQVDLIYQTKQHLKAVQSCSFAQLFGFQSKLCPDLGKQLLFIRNNAQPFMPGIAPRALDMDAITSHSKLRYFIQTDSSAVLLCGQIVY